MIAGSFNAIAIDSVRAETSQSNDSVEAEEHHSGECYKEVQVTHEGQTETLEMPLELEKNPYEDEGEEWVARAEMSITIGRFKPEQGELDIWMTTQIYDAPPYIDSDNLNGFYLDWYCDDSDEDSLRFSQQRYHRNGKNLAEKPLGGEVDEGGFDQWWEDNIEEYPNREKAAKVGLTLGKAALGEVPIIGTAVGGGETAYNVANILSEDAEFGDEDDWMGDRGYWYGKDNGYIDEDDEYMVQSNKLTWHFDPAEKNNIQFDITPTKDDTVNTPKVGPSAHAFELIFDEDDWTKWAQPNDFAAEVNDDGNVELDWDDPSDFNEDYCEVAGYRIESDSSEPWGEPYHGTDLEDDSVEEGETYTYKLMVKMSYTQAPDECFDWYNTGASNPRELTITVEAGNSGGGDDGGGSGPAPRPPGSYPTLNTP
ncbi:MAG: hypothetical protein ACOC87_04405 [Candidatus Natronoplasma sp.]